MGALQVEEQIALVQELEVVCNRVQALDMVVLPELERAGAAGRLCQGDLRRVLTLASGSPGLRRGDG